MVFSKYFQQPFNKFNAVYIENSQEKKKKKLNIESIRIHKKIQQNCQIGDQHVKMNVLFSL